MPVPLYSFLSTDRQLFSEIILTPSYALIFLGGRAETEAARELHAFFQTHLGPKSGSFHIILILDKVSFLSSTALGVLGKLRGMAREFFLVSGVTPYVQKGLQVVGIREDGERTHFFPSFQEFRKRVKIPPRLNAFMEEQFERLLKIDSFEVREADIIRSYHPQASLSEIQELLRNWLPLIMEAYGSNYLILPARFEAAVVVFSFLRRIAREIGVYDERGEEGLDPQDLETISKEVVENIVRWGYEGREGGFIVRASLQEDAMLVGFADWGKGYQPNLFRRLSKLGGFGQKRIEALLAELDPRRRKGSFVSTRSPAPVLRSEQKVEIERRLGPQHYGPGYVLVMRLPVLKPPEYQYQAGQYPANLVTTKS